MEITDTVILGGGVSGLAAASALEGDTVVLERSATPGGLVRAVCIDGYWFDHVLHLLHFRDDRTEARIHDLLGDWLAPCVPDAWVETAAGTVRYPFQMHLQGLDPRTVADCLNDLAAKTFGPALPPPRNFREMLLNTFGAAMCETFMFPYNEKVWKRPLDQLAPSGFQWNITHPDFRRVVEGAITDAAEFEPYNANGWYPRPPADHRERGMGVLSTKLAEQVADLRLNAEVHGIDLERREIRYRQAGQTHALRYERACAATLPLPAMLALCEQTPGDLLEESRLLTHNNVYTVAFCVRGPRPQGRGLWRYYADPDIVFNRLIYMHEFDPLSAPQDGWGLMAEITWPADRPAADVDELVARTAADVHAVGGMPADAEILNSHVIVADPAYVVFTPENQAIMERAKSFLMEHGISPLGRYGRWEYSSMAQVMRDGFDWADEINATDSMLLSASGEHAR